MLPAAQRLRRSEDFTTAVRRGGRAGNRHLVVHLWTPVNDGTPTSGPPRVGFVVSKAVGGSVVRHRVTRRLRHLARERTVRLPAGALLVVRALPAAATATSTELATSMDRALTRLLERSTGRVTS